MSRELPTIVDIATRLATPPPKPAEIVEGLMHRTCKMVVGGASKSYKTWSLLDLGISVSTGVPWWEFDVAQGRVLYVNLELHEAFLLERIKAICKAKGVTIAPDTFKLLNLRGCNVRMPQLRTHLETEMKGVDYSLAILDPTYKLMVGGEENSTADTSTLMNEIEQLGVNTGAGTAFGSHFTKGDQSTKNSIDRISGSGVLARDPDSIVTVTAHEEKDAFVVEPVLRNHSPVEKFGIRWVYPLFVRDELLDTGRLKSPGSRKRKLVNLSDYLTLFPDDWKIDPKESVHGVRALRSLFSRKGWNYNDEPALRDEAERMGALGILQGGNNCLYIGKPKVIEALRIQQEEASASIHKSVSSDNGAGKPQSKKGARKRK